jgi:SLOG-like protein
MTRPSVKKKSPAVFLSASVPDPRRNEVYHRTADVMAIRAAVSAFVNVVLGRVHLAWGGHPSITPMIWLIAQSLGVDYARAVTLYQSRFFKDDFPEENRRFKNVVYTRAVPGDMQASLTEMRRHMLTELNYTAGVFIGGMEGVEEEYRLLKLKPSSCPSHRLAVPRSASLKQVSFRKN